MEWIIITVIVIVAALVACILWAKQLSKHKFQCKACSKEFNAKWNKLLIIMKSDVHIAIIKDVLKNRIVIEDNYFSLIAV